jgi:sn-glycerol 3-phosphate transport system permease protein
VKPARRHEAVLLLAPTLALLALFFLFPFFLAARESFYSWDLLTPHTYVGFANYRAIWERGELARAFRNTLAYSAVV